MHFTHSATAIALLFISFSSFACTAPFESPEPIPGLKLRDEGDEYLANFPDGTIFVTETLEVVAPDTVYDQALVDQVTQQMKDGFTEGYAGGFDSSLAEARNDRGTLFLQFDLFDGVTLSEVPLDAWISVIEEFRTIVPEEGFPQFLRSKVAYDTGEAFKDLNTFALSFVIEAAATVA